MKLIEQDPQKAIKSLSVAVLMLFVIALMNFLAIICNKTEIHLRFAEWLMGVL